MDTASTIKEGWRFCTFASFIGCIILVFCFSRSNEYSRNLTNPGNLEIPAPSSQEFSRPLNITGNAQVIKKELYSCNIFDGKWVYNPKESPLYNGRQCPFLSEQVNCQMNGRPDFQYEKWNWEAKGCEIPRFSGVDMLEKLRGKRMILVGDSLNRNQWESLACLLYSSMSSSRAYISVHNGIYKVFEAKDYNCSVEFYWSPFLVQLETNKVNGSRILMLDRLSSLHQKWKGADIMVFNTGHWWVHHGKLKAWDLFQYDGRLVETMDIESAFEKALKTWVRWINDNVDLNKTKIFFRSISPEHKGKQACHNETQPIMDESYVPIFPDSVVDIMERTIRGVGTSIGYLNITKLSQYRIDAHPTVYKKRHTKQQRRTTSYGDCSHWCLPGLPDTWNRLLYALMLFDTSEDISSPSRFVV